MNPNELALLYRFHGGGRGGFEFVLLLAGLAFAGVLVWAIQRSGKSTTLPDLWSWPVVTLRRFCSGASISR